MALANECARLTTITTTATTTAATTIIIILLLLMIRGIMITTAGATPVTNLLRLTNSILRVKFIYTN